MLWSPPCDIAVGIGLFSVIVQCAFAWHFYARLPYKVVTQPVWFPVEHVFTVVPRRVLIVVNPCIAAVIGICGMVATIHEMNLVLQIAITDILQAVWLIITGWIYHQNRTDWF